MLSILFQYLLFRGTMQAIRLLFFFVALIFGGWIYATDVQVFFSPKDNVATHLIDRIDNEEKQVLVAVYCLSHRGVSDALIRAKRRGVQVEVIVDPFSLYSKMALGKLTHAKVDLSVWDEKLSVPIRGGKAMQHGGRRPLMHNKFCVFGDSVVWTGSFNFTYDATYAHRENVVVIEDEKLAACYIREFQEIKKLGARPFTEFMSHYPKKKKNVLDALMRR